MNYVIGVVAQPVRVPGKLHNGKERPNLAPVALVLKTDFD